MMWEVNSLSLSISVFVILCGLWLTGKFLNEEAIYIYESSLRRKKHGWRTIRNCGRACFCSICEILVPSNGLFCECCNICVCQSDIGKAEKLLKCKEKHVREKAQKHLWVHGNLPPNHNCFICGEDIDSHFNEPGGLYGFRCSWCQRSCHDECFEQVSDECDFGELKDFLIPPNSMVVARSRGVPKLHLTGLNPPTDILNWSPLIVIANTKSGSSEAKEVVAAFRGLLNPLQVIEIGGTYKPADALQWALISPVKCRVLVAGGDGTVGWVLNTIEALKVNPNVAILPLGTGNDLSRVLGWGHAAPQEIDMKIFERLRRATAVPLDRWKVDIQLPTAIPLRPRRQRSLFLYNYLSIGVDALVTLNFHKARASSFYIFSSRIINKFLYFFFGGHQVLFSGKS